MLDPTTCADRLSAYQRWSDLKEFIACSREPLLQELKRYLRLDLSEVATGKKEISNSIAIAISSLDLIEKYPPHRLLETSRILGQFSFFEAAAACRFAYLAKCGGSSQEDCFTVRAIRAEMAGADREELQILGERYGFPDSVTGYLEAAPKTTESRLVLSDLEKNSEQLQALRSRSFNAIEDGIFRRAKSNQLNLENQRVLLVGPSVRETEPVERKDFNLIARIGYRGSQSIANFEAFGTDASFYKDHKLSDLEPAEIERLAKELDYMIVSGICSGTMKKLRNVENLHYSPISGLTFLKAECNAGIEAALVFLHAGADSVHLTNTDLFLNSVYPAGYKSNNYEQIQVNGGWSLESETLCRSLIRNHAPSTQFCLYRLFWKQKKIKGDSVFEGIMSGGLIKYLRRLQESYHPFLRIS